MKEFQGKRLQVLANTMLAEPDNFMVDEQSRLFSKCASCDEWHLLHEIFRE